MVITRSELQSKMCGKPPSRPNRGCSNGLCNAPTTFTRVMNDLFRPFIDEFFLVYLDYILVFSRTWDEHVCHVKKVLDLLKREELFLKLSKCEFGKTSLVYLGHIFGNG